MQPIELHCEYKQNPLAIDAISPRLFWKTTGSGRGRRQTAYQILVARSPDMLAKNTGDLWDSGKVASSDTIQIPYRGAALASTLR